MPNSGRVLVTGATGFLGSRLVQVLLADDVRVRALVRRPALLSENRPRGLESVGGDVTDAESTRKAAASCEVIFHCAWGGSSLSDSRHINVEGTRNVMTAAAAAGVRRVVHVSSMAVHGQRLPAVLTEDFPLTESGDAYSVSKAEGEKLAFQLGAAHGIEVVALRPTLIYGPNSPLWLMSYFMRVKRGRVALISGGTGLANLVYVDDVVTALLASASRSGVAGEAFMVNGSQAVTWREYLGYYADMCGRPLPPAMSPLRARIELEWTRAYALMTQRPRRLQGMDLTLMTQRTTVSIEKARRLLAWEPKVSLEDGMRRCEAWLRERGDLAPDVRPAVVASSRI